MPPFLPYITGPLIGAVIGYFTNYLAVRMLFRPLYPKRIGRFRLPFTPGIIPKRKPALAHALGAAVGELLLTGDDLAALLLSPAAVDRAAEAATDAVMGAPGQAIAVRISSLAGGERYDGLKASLDLLIARAILRSLGTLDLGGIIVSEGGAAIREFAPPLVSMFLGDKFLDTLAEPIGGRVKAYLADSGEELILPAVAGETERLLASDTAAFLAEIGSGRENIKALAEQVCGSFLKERIARFLTTVDIAGAVERKINEMDVRELERLLLSVMRRELNAIVSLGALIGLVLGILTAFF